MFAEELSGSATRKRQQENRTRRLQMKTDKQKQDAKTTTATTAVTAAASGAVANGPTLPLAGVAPATTLSPISTPDEAMGNTGGKSAAVANALQQRQLRQTSQLQAKSAIQIQTLVRSFLSNCQRLNYHSQLLAKRLTDLGKLRTLLNQKNPDSPFAPPPATTTALVQQLLFLTTPIPYKRKQQSSETGKSGSTAVPKSGAKIKLRSVEVIVNLQRVLEFSVIPGLQGQDDNLNPLLPWLESAQGTYRLKFLLAVCLLVAASKNAPLSCVSVIGQFLSLSLGVDKQYPLTPKARQVIPPQCRSWLIVNPMMSASPRASNNSSPSSPMKVTRTAPAVGDNKETMDIFQTLRKLLLFTIGGPQPIPSNSAVLREKCISAKERSHADILFQLVVNITQSIVEQRQHLEARFFSEIISIPLLTWKLSSSSIAQLLALTSSVSTITGTGQLVLLVSMVASFIELHKQPLSSGRIGLLLPVVEVPMTQCPATNTQCLLANLIALGRVCPSLNGSDRTKMEYLSAATFFQFLATLLDVIPLGTYLSRDSAVEWVTDGKGHHTPIVLSSVILDQCKLLLVESFVRNLFQCAIDSGALRTESILAAKNDKDLKHEADLKEAAGAGTATAATMAAKEARVERNRAWLSSKWASKLKKGVSGLLASTKTDTNVKPNYGDGGKGMLVETSAVSKSLASGVKDRSSEKAVQASKEVPGVAKRTSLPARYNPALLFALCRMYATVLARWGGGGKEDIISRVEGRKNEIATARPDPCSMALLNVLCFGTDLVKTSWGLIQGDKELASELANYIDRSKGASSIRSTQVRPSYDTYKSGNGKMGNDGAVLMYMFVSSLSHTLIITDDAEIYEMGRPLPIHQLRRCIQLLKKLLLRACNVDGSSSDRTTSPFGLSLVSSCSKAMRDLYDRSSRRPLCVPKLWLVEHLMVKEIQNCKSHADYVALLSNPVLRLCPFLVSFKRRLKLFERIITTSRIEMQGVNDANPFNSNPLKPGIPVQIMRGRILEDGLATLNKLGRSLRQRINVQYLNEAGTRESGIDAGGLFKEFWTDLCAIAFNPNYALFRVTEDDQNCLYPNPSSGAAHGRETHIVLFEFLGRILGKALYEGITISPQFSHFFLSFLRGDYNYLHMLPDLISVDAQLYNNLLFLKTFDGDAADLCLTFSVANDDFGGNTEINLVPNGSNIDVTNSNKLRYIGLVAKYYVVDRVKEQSEAFTRGLWDVIDKSWLRLFNEPELQVLISGATGAVVDVDDMRANSRYNGGYTGMERTTVRFWNVVASFNVKQQADLLRFVTSCERPPPLGFASLNPPFTIQRVGIMRDTDKLPTASTCFNTLKLPTYSSEKVMRERLLYAIEAGAGFELA